MGRYAKLMDTPKARAVFKAQYRIPNVVEIRHCDYGEWLVLHRPPESLVTFPMGSSIPPSMKTIIGIIVRTKKSYGPSPLRTVSFTIQP